MLRVIKRSALSMPCWPLLLTLGMYSMPTHAGVCADSPDDDKKSGSTYVSIYDKGEHATREQENYKHERANCALRALTRSKSLITDAMRAEERGETAAMCQSVNGALLALKPYEDGDWRDDYEEVADKVDSNVDVIWGIFHKTNCPQLIERFKKSADEGRPWGQFSLANRYADGRGVPKDVARAVELYQNAIAQGYTDAMFNLGWMYEHAEGVAEDKAKAFALYMQAAKADDSAGQYRVGYCYRNGIGVEQNFAEAVVWFKKAKSNDNSDAEVQLKEMYESGQAKKSFFDW
jgi:TPR repeat protein